MPRGRPPKTPKRETVQTRDPVPQNRDPVIEPKCEPRPYKTRHCIQASMPTICPKCGHNTRMDDGRHVDPVRARIVEYRTCIKCKHPVGAVRPMTEREKERLCKGACIVKDYEEIVNSEVSNS